MKKVMSFGFSLGCALFLLTACSAAFEPAWKAKKGAILEFQFSSRTSAVQEKSLASKRAIIQGDGFLYIQTGASLSDAKLFGPYSLRARESLEIKNIPPGEYPFIALIISDILKGDSLPITVDGTEAENINESVESAFIASLPEKMGKSAALSYKIIKNLNIEAGQVTTIRETLIPLSSETIDLAWPSLPAGISIPSSGSTMGRKFIALRNTGSETPSGNSLSQLFFTLKNAGEQSAQYDTLILYNEDGTLLKASDLPPQTLESGAIVNPLTADYPGGSVFFAYLEYTGANLYLEVSGVLKHALTYTITYDVNTAEGGTVPVDSTSYLEGAEATVRGNTGSLTKNGYAFTGWNTAPDGKGTAYAAGTPLTVTKADIILYAQWSVNEYTLAYDKNGALAGTLPSEAAAYPEGTSITVLGNTGVLSKTGYSFSLWNTAQDGSGTSYAPGATLKTGKTPLTLYTQWTIISSSITYNSNGATSGSPPTAAAYTYGTLVSVSENTGTLAKDGNTFSGWNTAIDGSGTSYATGSVLTMGAANIVLYAQWSPVPVILVAAAANGNAYRSTNGTSWSAAYATGLTTINALAYGGSGMFVAVGTKSTSYGIATSPDGITWTSRNLSDTPAIISQIVANESERLVAVSTPGGVSTVYSSSDGIVWTGPVSVSYPATTPVYLDGTWYIANGNGSVRASSPDGSAWTAINGVGGSMYKWNALGGINGKLLVGGGAPSNTNKQVLISSDYGASFAAATNVSTAGYYVTGFSAVSASRIIAIGTGTSGQIAWSDNSGTS